MRAGLDQGTKEFKMKAKVEINREKNYQKMTDEIYADEWRASAFPKMFAMPTAEIKTATKHN